MRSAATTNLAIWLYAIGIAQLCLLLAPALLLPGPPPNGNHDIALGGALTELLRTSPDGAALARIRRDAGVDVSLYDDRGKLVLSNVDPPLRAPEGSERPMRDWIVERFDADGHARLLVARTRGGSHRWPPPPLLNFLCGFVVIALGALITRRWIVQPLRALSRTAQAFGGGDLRARVETTRRDEVGEVALTFNEMADRIQRLLLAEKELLANVSHELRTPVARIRVALQLAAEGDAEASRASLAEIATDLQEIETMIEDILMATRMAVTAQQGGAGGFTLRRERLASADIAARAGERFMLRHARRLLTTVAEGLPDVRGDAVLLRRVLDNLLENANKYSPDPESPIHLNALAAPDHVIFEVVDQGEGIPEEDIPRLFEPFFRCDRSRSHRTGGIGLGLTLVQRIVEAHGGRVEISSRLNEGTRVRVLLPRAPA